MKRFNKIIASAAVLFAAVLPLFLCSFKSASGVPEPSKEFYVYDEADVLDSVLEQYIIGKNVDLYGKCGGQIVVSCVKTTGDTDISDYAYTMFNKWKIGSSSKNNGILVLLSIDEDDYWVLQGRGLEELLQSGTIKLLLDEKLEPYFAKKQYAAGVRALFDALISEYEQIYSIKVDGKPVEGAESGDLPEPVVETAKEPVTFGKVISGFATLVVGFAAAVILIIIVLSVIITFLVIIASVFSSGTGGAARTSTRTFTSSTFRPSGTFFRGTTFRGGGFSSGSRGGFSGGSHGGFSGGSHGGFSGGSHGGFSGGSHSGGGGSSRGGGAGRR